MLSSVGHIVVVERSGKCAQRTKPKCRLSSVELERFMATNIDWIARLRTSPSEACPSLDTLEAFVLHPESVTASSFSHIVAGCVGCRAKLQEIALHPSAAALRGHIRQAEDVPEDVVLHYADCEFCQSRVRGALSE